MAWTRDLACAYAGGLVLGAPFALAAVWLTGVESIATASLLVAMALVLVALRRRPSRLQEYAPAAESTRDTSPAASRRVA